MEGWAARKPGKVGHTGGESGSLRGLRFKLTEELSEGFNQGSDLVRFTALKGPSGCMWRKLRRCRRESSAGRADWSAAGGR